MAYSVPPQTESQTIDGYGKDPWQPNGGLEGRVFNSRCPPPLTRETIIVSVLGPSDRGNNASPDTDGWLVSDFFLFHHLFRDTALEQHWLTCVSPATLISKYGQYTHGDPHSEDRRTVLDSTFEGELNDVEVFGEFMLGERFLAYVADASKRVKDTNNPILVLIFGHGDPMNGSILIGSDVENHTHLLKREMFHSVVVRHNKQPHITVVAVSCYAGHWAEYISLNTTVTGGSEADR